MKSIALHLRKECKNQKVLCTNFLSSSVFIALFLFMGFYATAQTSWTVTSTADTGVGTLRTLIVDSASAGDTIRFSSAIDGDTIVLTSGQILLDKDLVICGNDSSLTKIDGNNNSRAFTISDSVQVEIKKLSLLNCNSIGSHGGAISNSGQLTLYEVSMNGNRSSESGGAIHNAASGTCWILQSSIKDNVGDNGGAVNNEGRLVISNTTFEDNSDRYDFSHDGGGALYSTGPSMIDSSRFRNNHSYRDGGAIYSTDSLSISYSEITNNRAAHNSGPQNRGGGIYSGGTGSWLSVYASTLAGNRADDGGGIYSGASLINNSTISFNTTVNHGRGGGAHAHSGSMKIMNSTLNGNESGSGLGGGLYVQANLTLYNTIIAGNIGFIGPDIYKSSGTINALSSYNLIGDNDFYGLAAGNFNILGTYSDPVNPGLDTLADNGGFTFTQALLTCSPAINNGYSDTIYDQRGFLRNQFGRSDIGAFESHVFLGPFTRVVTNANNSGAGSLRQIIAEACFGDTIVFDTILNGMEIVLTSGEIVLNKNIFIRGNGASNTIISGNNNHLIFHVPGTTVTLQGLALKKGRSNNFGGAIYNQGDLKVLQCHLKNNGYSYLNGGGIFNKGHLRVFNSTLSGNTGFTGSAIYSENGTVHLYNTTISRNTSEIYTPTPSIYLFSTSTQIASSTIVENDGGGIEVSYSSSLLLTNTIVGANTHFQGKLSGAGSSIDPASSYNLVSDASSFGMPAGNGNILGNDSIPVHPLQGPLQNNGGSTPTHSLRCGSPALNNGSADSLTDQAGQPRGALGADDIGAFERQDAPAIQTMRLVTSTADSGPGTLRQLVADACPFDTIVFDTLLNGSPISLTSGPIIFDSPITILGNEPANTIIDSNDANNYLKVRLGVNVYMEGVMLQNMTGVSAAIINSGNLKLYQVSFKNNSSTDNDGTAGLTNLKGGECEVSNCTFSNHDLDYNASVISNHGTCQVYNSTFYNNEANTIYQKAGTLTLNFSTIVYDQDGKAITVSGGDFSMHNSILDCDNCTYSYAAINQRGGTIDTLSSHNLIEANSVNALISGPNNILGTSSEPVDALLAPLANNGGLTQTCALLNCSPAINAGMDDTLTDQRGVARGQFGGTDIGAFEAEFDGFRGRARVVTTLANNGPGSLRNQIAASCHTDTILFDKSLNGNAIVLTGNEISINMDLIIIGNGRDSTIIDGNGSDRVFNVQSDNDVSIKGLTIQNGWTNFTDGAGIFNDGSLKLEEVRIANNQSHSGEGAGVYNEFRADCHISNSEIINNTTTSGNGGGIYNNATSQFTIVNTKIMNNEARYGGGIRNAGTIEIRGCIIDSNEATDFHGGAIYNSGIAHIESSQLRGNETDKDGGAIFSTNQLYVTASTIEDNVANDAGGGIRNEGSICEVFNSTISNNTGENGGGISSSHKLTIVSSTLSGNTAVNNGGGIHSGSPKIVVVNSTLTGNHANQGGGIFKSSGSQLIQNTIVAQNTATNQGPDIHMNSATIDTNSSYNLVGVGDGLGLPPGKFNKYGTSAQPLSPGLDSLADNGGLTFTHALLPGSPAFDAGSTDSTADQRGYARDIFCRADIGAYESETNLVPAVFDSLSFTCDFLISPISNEIWDTSGFYVDSVSNIYGCDSIRYDIDLQINSPAYTVLDTFAYYSYTSPSGKHTWNESGAYVDTVIDSNGCGRIYHINLTINCNWKTPGFATDVKVTTQSAATTRIVFDNSDTPYIVFRDRVLDKARVRMFDGIDWKNVGGQGFSAGDVSSTDIAIDKNGVLYVAFRDFTQGNKVTVMKYADTSWVIVGSAGLSAAGSEYISLVLDTSGVPMVGYGDADKGFRATVQRFNSGTNSWDILGSAGFSPGGANHIAMATDPAGVPYIVFRDGNTADRNATVMSYNGSSWVVVDTVGFTAGRAHFNDIAIDASGTPYVVYQDNAFENKASVKKLVGGHWQTVGIEGFSAGAVEHTRIALDQSGRPYVVYRDSANQRANVMTFENNQWTPLGSTNFSNSGSSFTSIAIDGEGNPMVALAQGGVKAYSFSCVSGSELLIACDSLQAPGGREYWTEDGTFRDTLVNSLGNDSIVMIGLKINHSNDTILYVSTCGDYTSPSGHYIWDTTGIYTDTLTNITGCDSLLTIHLTLQISHTTLNLTGCDSVVSPSGLYTWTSTGTYMDTLQNSNGCDSLITANVTVHPSTASTLNATACYSYSSPSGSYTWNTSGTYLDTVTNGNGCDSVITVNLTLNVNDTTLNLTGCDSVLSPSGLYTWTSSGTYRDTLQNSNGCDSLITANVTVHPSTASTISPTACYSYSSPSGLYTWNTSGTYLDTVTNGNGCDSVITVNLTLNVNDTTLNFTGCDSVVSPSGLYTWISSGTYMDTLQNSNGCDSLITANVTIHQCPVDCQMGAWSAWSACDTICGGGLRFRTRNILVAAAQGGIACGDTIEYDTCNVQPCCTTTNTYFTDSICPGDSLFVANAWQSTIGTYVDGAVSVLGCDSLLHTALYFKDSSFCIVDSTVETILYLVSDSAWTLSTVVTVETSNSYPWPGAAAYVPHDSTFTLPVEVGQPYSWTHLYTVMGSEVITSRSGVTYYRYVFELTEHQALNARFRMFVDDNMQIFINRQEIALEEDMGKVNWRTANHDLLFDDTGAIFNGYNGGDPFDYYTLSNLDSVFQTGANDIILAIRNRTSKPDIGGFSFRMDLDKAGKAVIVKKDEEINQGATSLGIVVYPNPTTGWLQVNLINGQDEGTLNVLDVAGRLLMQKKMSQSTELNLESFSQGVYLVRVTSGGRSYTVRVVKN